ncbi:MAG: biopolymer transporter ExbD [Planctomycetota bacterium]
MRSRIINVTSGNEPAFNLTPVIDIVFLLIIFFAVVCKFIEAENFPVAVPTGCENAQSDVETQTASTTVTVMKTDGAMSEFAVGSEKIQASNYAEVADKLSGLINERLKTLPSENRTVTLRIDKDVAYSEAQYALAALAKSNATDIRLAVIRDGQADSQ